jgi:hypothetical protein
VSFAGSFAAEESSTATFSIDASRHNEEFTVLHAIDL